MTNKNENQGKPLRLVARELDQACAAEDVDAETRRYHEEELGLTPLHVAAFTGSIKQVKELLQAGIGVNITDKLGWIPLHDAAIKGRTKIVKLLLAAGANVNAQDKEDLYTPLHDAVRMNYPEIVQLLVAADADFSISDVWGNTAIDIAQEYKFDDIINLLSKP